MKNKLSKSKQEYFKKLKSLSESLPKSDSLDVMNLVYYTSMAYLDYSPHKDFSENKYTIQAYSLIEKIGLENIHPHIDLLNECVKSFLVYMIEEAME